MHSAPPLYHLIDLWISLTRSLHEHADAAHQDRFGTRLGDLLIRAAIYLASVENRPMTTAKLAVYVGMARPSVERRLRALERGGVVVRRARGWCTPAPLLKHRGQEDFSDTVHVIHKAIGRLSRTPHA